MGLNRRDFLRTSGGALSSLAVSTLEGAISVNAKPSAAVGRPNILLIVTDQEQSFEDLPAGLDLPARQQLLERGVAYSNYHVTTTPCSPSRSVIYTGQHTQHTKIFVNTNTPPQPELSTEMPTIGHMLRDAGYFTAYKGKWHLSNVNAGRNFSDVPTGLYPNTTDALNEYGFSDYNFNGERIGLTWDGYQTDGATAGDASRLLFNFAQNDAAGGKPWFLAVNFVNPHDIMFYDATGRQSETRIAKNFLAPFLEAPADPIYSEDLGYDLPESFYKDDLSTKPEAQRAIVRLGKLFFGELPKDDIESWRRFRNYYFNCVRDVDRHISTVLWALAQSGQADNTIVIFTSDHGERAGAHGMRQKGGTIYKEDVRVPMVVVHPDVKQGFRTPALFSAVDLVPTMLSLAGVDPATTAARYPALKGVDISRTLEDGGNRSARDERGLLYNYAVGYYWEPHRREDDGNRQAPEERGQRFDLKKRRLHRGVHDGRYKFARYFAPAEHHKPGDWQTLTAHNDLELYDTQADPNELVNLAADPDAHRELILRLNAMTNTLIDIEVGVDNGSEYPGPVELYNTL